MADTALERMRAICLALPHTKETPTWGEPHFRVGDKIFAGYGEKEGKAEIGFKLEMAHAIARVEDDSRFRKAPYVGHKGWVSMDVSGETDWDLVARLVGESYRLIAPKRLLAQIDGNSGPAPTREVAAASRNAAARTSAARAPKATSRKAAASSRAPRGRKTARAQSRQGIRRARRG